MKRTLVHISIAVIFIVHIGIAYVILFGWLYPQWQLWYQLLLLLTILNWVIARSCILTVWEFQLRKIVEPDIELYEYQFIDYYLRKIFSGGARPEFIHRVGLFFLIVSLILNIRFHGIAFLS